MCSVVYNIKDEPRHIFLKSLFVPCIKKLSPINGKIHEIIFLENTWRSEVGNLENLNSNFKTLVSKQKVVAPTRPLMKESN